MICTAQKLTCSFLRAQFAILIVLPIFSSVIHLNEVDGATLLPRQQQPTLKDGGGIFNSWPLRNNWQLLHPLSSIPNGHYKANAFEGSQRKPDHFNQKIQEELNEYGLRQRVPHYIQNVIQDMNLLRRLLEGGFLNVDEERQIDVPFFNRPTNTERQGLAPNELLVPAKRRGSGCVFHGGLAHNCDYKDLVRAVDEADHWGSELSPGK